MSLKKLVEDKITFLKNDFDLFELLKGGFSSLSGKLLGMVFGYMVALFISNIYGPETFGMYAISITVLSVAVLIPKFGFDFSLVRLLNEILVKGNKSNFISVINRTSLLVFTLSIVASIILYFSAGFIALKFFKNENLKLYFEVVAWSVTPVALLTIFSGTFQALKQTFYYMLFKTALINIGFFIILLLNYFVFSDDPNLMYFYAIASYLALVIGYLIYKRTITKRDFSEASEHHFDFKNILNISYPMMFSDSFALLLGWINIFLLGYYISESDVGIYDSAERLTALTNIVLLAVNSIAAPKFAEEYANNNMDQLKIITKKSTKLIFFSSLPFMVMFLVFGEFFLRLFGPEFTVGYWALFYLCIGKFMSSIAGSVGYLLQMTGNQKTFQNVIFFALVINLILSIILIPSMGLMGAAIAKCIAIVFWNVTLVIIIYRKFGFWTVYVPFVTKI